VVLRIFTLYWDLFNLPKILIMASIIDKTLAKMLIASYREQNSEVDGTRLLTPDGKFLNGFFIDRHSLDSILSNADVVGISLNFARHPEFAEDTERVFTLVFSGAEHNPDYKKGSGIPPYIIKDHVWDQVEPCPPVCANII